tara:strand:- start:7 stop:519 length:513 start_codon:yes stop_codon:yes gene_type:complete
MLPLLALAPYAPAAVAGIGALAKGLSGGRGQRIVQGGVNLANRGLTSLQPYTDALKSNFANKPMKTSLSTLFGLSEVSDPEESTVAMMLEGLKKSAKYLAADEKERKQMIQNLHNYLGIDKDQALIDAGNELLEKKKKGGYVKKQRKRKPYKSSAFVKMKKNKKKKYIKK